MDMIDTRHGADRVEVFHPETGLFTVHTIETVFADPITGMICAVEYHLQGHDETALELDKDNFRMVW